MRIRKMTRVSFSDNTLNIDLPKAWHELSQDELLTLYGLASTGRDVKLIFFFFISGLKIIRKIDGGWLCIVPYKKDRKRVFMTAEKLACITEQLDWINEPGNVPVRLDRMRKCEAVNAQLHGLSFGNWLRVENMYQGLLMSQNTDALLAIAKILYPGFNGSALRKPEQLNVLNWVVQLKNMFALEFKWLFAPGESLNQPSMLEIMNNQIRILTGGDITREKEVRECDCWRALTELNFKAKESEDFKKDLRKNGR